MVREEHHVGVAVDADLRQRLADAADVVVQILDHRVVAGELEAGARPDGRRRRHVGPQAEGGRVDARRAVGGVGGRHRGAVRRLHREDGEEWLVGGAGVGRGQRAARFGPAPAAAHVAAQMVDEQVAQGVGLVAGQPLRRLAVAAVHVAVVLVVVVLVAHPVAKAAAPLRGHVVRAVVAAVQVPLADVRGVVAGGGERVRRGGELRRQRRRGADGAGLMRVAAGKQGGAKRRAPRRAGHRAVEAHTLPRQIVDVGREHVVVAAVAGGVGAVLVAEDPQHVRRPRGAQGEAFAHGFALGVHLSATRGPETTARVPA